MVRLRYEKGLIRSKPLTLNRYYTFLLVYLRVESCKWGDVATKSDMVMTSYWLLLRCKSWFLGDAPRLRPGACGKTIAERNIFNSDVEARTSTETYGRLQCYTRQYLPAHTGRGVLLFSLASNLYTILVATWISMQISCVSPDNFSLSDGFFQSGFMIRCIPRLCDTCYALLLNLYYKLTWIPRVEAWEGGSSSGRVPFF